MIKEKLEQEARDYLRVQTQLNGGGLFSCNVRNLLIGFAESKEKRIEELEKENEIFKKANEIIAQQRDDRDRDIAKLEEENEELKSEKGCETCTKFDEVKLTKAIGIIKRWYETNRSACIEPSQELIEVTEQFIKEIEK